MIVLFVQLILANAITYSLEHSLGIITTDLVEVFNFDLGLCVTHPDPHGRFADACRNSD